MIDTIIFDFGQVLCHVKAEDIIRNMTDLSHEDKENFISVVFDRLYWDKSDMGEMSEAEMIANAKERLPEHLHQMVYDILHNWYGNCPLMNGMPELVKALKMKGYSLYLLSNIAIEFVPHWKEYPYAEWFDGAVFSGPIHMVKPNHEIFQYLCDQYQIKKENAVFIDDNEKNVNGAKSFGMNSILFNENVEELKSRLRTMHVLIDD